MLPAGLEGTISNGHGHPDGQRDRLCEQDAEVSIRDIQM